MVTLNNVEKMNFYDLRFRRPNGEEQSMKQFSGKALLLVNTATKCGLAPQFRELEELHQKYKDKGLVVIGFPSNQFLNQEPESNESMEQSCEVNFGVTFMLSEKIHVNGRQTHPVFVYLKNQLPGKWSKKIKWNFTKFLISPEGKALKRYAPSVKPLEFEQDIQSALPEQ